MNNKKSCTNCKYRFGDFGDFCHRYPPTVIILKSGRIEYLHPKVSSNSWCGEYKKVNEDE